MSQICTFTNCTFDSELSVSPEFSNNDKSFLNRARRYKNKRNSYSNDNPSFYLDPFLIPANNKFQINKTDNKKFVSDLTEIETLKTHLRFRRQSIQQMRVSPMVLFSL